MCNAMAVIFLLFGASCVNIAPQAVLLASVVSVNS